MKVFSLKREWIYGWLLLLPALVFLFAFTHIPAVTTFLNSFFSTPRGRRPAKFIGLDNYERMLGDAVFWKVLWNNLWYALGTIPISVGLAIVMALWVNEKLAGRSFVRMAYFTPTVLPLIAVANMKRSRDGRALVAVRDHYLSAEIMGINLTKYRILAFGVSSFFAGLGGALFLPIAQQQAGVINGQVGVVEISQGIFKLALHPVIENGRGG